MKGGKMGEGGGMIIINHTKGAALLSSLPSVLFSHLPPAACACDYLTHKKSQLACDSVSVLSTLERSAKMLLLNIALLALRSVIVQQRT